MGRLYPSIKKASPFTLDIPLHRAKLHLNIVQLIQRGGGTGPLNPRQPDSFPTGAAQVPNPAGSAEVSVAP
jgi:hypothetical protein